MFYNLKTKRGKTNKLKIKNLTTKKNKIIFFNLLKIAFLDQTAAPSLSYNDKQPHIHWESHLLG